MDITYRAVAPEEVKDFVRAVELAFGEVPPDDERDAFANVIEPDRTIAAMDGEKMIGTAGAFSFEMTIPGAQIPVAGVTVVGVHPTHRRRGILTEMMKRQLLDIHERGETVAMLWASEASIYQRFGYGLGSIAVHIDIDRDKAWFINDPGRSGRVELVDPIEQLDVINGIYDTVRMKTPGLFSRSENWWKNHTLFDPPGRREGASETFTAVLELDGAPSAFAMYRVRSNWDDGSPQGTVEVLQLMATSPEATREMWRFVFEIDLVAKVKAYWQPIDSPLFLMLMELRRLRARTADSLWTRIVDLPGAFEARSYSGTGSFTVAVTDELCGWNEGTWSFEISDGKAVVTQTDAEAEMSMTINELGSVYLGAFTFAELARAGRMTGPAGAIRRADSLLSTDIKPWCPEIF